MAAKSTLAQRIADLETAFAAQSDRLARAEKTARSLSRKVENLEAQIDANRDALIAGRTLFRGMNLETQFVAAQRAFVEAVDRLDQFETAPAARRNKAAA